MPSYNWEVFNKCADRKGAQSTNGCHCLSEVSMLKRMTIVFLLALVVGAGLLPDCFGADTGWESVGMRGGTNSTDSGNTSAGDFLHLALFANHYLPWAWQPAGFMTLHTRFDVSAGALERDRQYAFCGSAGPSLALGMFSDRFTLDGGVEAGGVTRHDFKARDLGGPFLFTLHGGASVVLGWNLALGYRFQHLSNADLYDKNPGLNLHCLEIKYLFPKK